MISIIMPAYNEEKRIEEMVSSYLSFFRKNKQKFEIIVAINNSKDRTEEIVKKISGKYREVSYLNLEEKGKGFAIVRGFQKALEKNSELIGFVDSDCSTPPEAFYDLVKYIKNYDGIIADRWNKKSVIKTKQTLLRRFVSRGYNLVVRVLFLFPYRDTQCGAKLFKGEILKGMTEKIMSSQWNFDVDLLFCIKKWKRAKVISIPTIWEDRRDSKINLKLTPIRMFASCIRLRLIHSPFRDFVRLYRKLPEKWKFH